MRGLGSPPDARKYLGMTVGTILAVSACQGPAKLPNMAMALPNMAIIFAKYGNGTAFLKKTGASSNEAALNGNG